MTRTRGIYLTTDLNQASKDLLDLLPEIYKLNKLTYIVINVLQDFCKLVLDYLTKGPNTKVYQNAAQILSVDPDLVQSSVEALINVLIECCKHKVSELDFRDSILTVGFSEEQSKILQEFYNSHLTELSRVLVERTVDFPQFKNIEWRLEAQVASRALLEQMEPQIMLKLSLESSSGPENILLQSDATNLFQMTEALEAALNECKGQSFRRIQRRLK